MDALKQLGPEFECYLIETEFWGQMTDPNLMVEINAQDLGDLMTATSFHIGEVKRNPYHLLLPAWMMDSSVYENSDTIVTRSAPSRV